MTPQQVLNQTEADLKAYGRASPEPELEETFRRIWEVIRAGRLYAGQPRNAETARCVSLARSAVRVAETANNDALLHDAWRMLAYAFTADEQYCEANRYWDRVISYLEKTGQPGQAARCRLGYVATLFHSDRYEEALAVASVAERWFRNAGDESGYARLCTNVGNIYHRLDDHQRAYAYHSKAVEAFEKIGDRQCMAQGYLNLGNVLAGIDRFDEADSMYERVERLGGEVGMKELCAHAASNRSYLWFLRGRYSDALRSLEELRKRFEHGGSIRHALFCDLDRAEIYMRLNLSQDVIALARETAAQFQQMNMDYERAKAMTFAAVAHAQTLDFSNALAALEEAAAIFDRQGNAYWSAMLQVYRAEVLLTLGRLDEARKLALAARSAFDSLNIPSRKAQCLTLLGRIASKAGDQVSAQRHVDELASIVEDHDIPLVHFDYCMLRGDVALSAQRKNEARSHYERAAADLERSQSQLHHDDLRLGLLRGGRLVYERLVSLLLAQPDCFEDAKNAYFWCEKAKSRGLVELLSGHMPSVESKAGEEELKNVVRLREELNAAYARLKPEEPITSSKTYAAISAKENEFARALREASHIDPDYVSLQQVSGASVEDVQRSLPPNSALVEYFVADDRVMAFVIGPSGFKVFPNLCSLGCIEEVAERLSFQIEKFLLSRELVETYAGTILQATNEHLHELYSELFEPLAGQLQAGHLFIIGHGTLHFLPFHAMYDGERYLIDRYTISYASSASVLQSCWKKEDVNGASPALFGVADESVRFIDAEIAAVSSLFSDSRTFTAGNAKRETFRQEVRSAEFVHVAAHSLFRHDNPMFSGFKLADGWFNAIDLYSMKCDTNLVTLSGCRSGLSGIAGGDDLLGLIRGFLYAGARSLLVSLWHVEDRAACALMHHFYAEWQKGESKSAALRNAMVAVRNVYPHPVFWAPFALVGKA